MVVAEEGDVAFHLKLTGQPCRESLNMVEADLKTREMECAEAEVVEV